MRSIGDGSGPLRAYRARNCIPFRRGRSFRAVARDIRLGLFREVPAVRGTGEFVHAIGGDSPDCVGSDRRRKKNGRPADPGGLVTLGLPWQRDSPRDVWNSHGDLLRAQVADGLLGLLGLRRRWLAHVARVQPAPRPRSPEKKLI